MSLPSKPDTIETESLKRNEMKTKATRDEVVLCSEEAHLKIGSIFDTVLVLSQRMRELRNGYAPLVKPSDTHLATAYHEILEGKIDRTTMYHSPPKPLRKGYHETR